MAATKKKPALTIKEFLEERGISPMEELIEALQHVSPELQVAVWKDILNRVDPPPAKVAGSDGNIPRVIKLESEADLMDIVDGTSA